MDNKQKISNLRMEMQGINYAATRVTSALHITDRMAGEKRKQEIMKELRQLVPKRIEELEEQRNELEKKYSFFSRKLYKMIGWPKNVGKNEEQITRNLLEKEELITMIC